MKRLVCKEETWCYSSRQEAEHDKTLKSRDWRVSNERVWMGEIHITYIFRY